MRNTILLLALLLLGGASSVFAQATTPPPVPKMKVGIVDILAFRDQIGELKIKYDKLQKEFATLYQELETMQGTLANQEKVLNENKGLLRSRRPSSPPTLRSARRTTSARSRIHRCSPVVGRRRRPRRSMTS